MDMDSAGTKTGKRFRLMENWRPFGNDFRFRAKNSDFRTWCIDRHRPRRRKEVDWQTVIRWVNWEMLMVATTTTTTATMMMMVMSVKVLDARCKILNGTNRLTFWLRRWSRWIDAGRVEECRNNYWHPILGSDFVARFQWTEQCWFLKLSGLMLISVVRFWIYWYVTGVVKRSLQCKSNENVFQCVPCNIELFRTKFIWVNNM